MSQGKIIPLIAAAQRDAEAHARAEIRELIDAIDDEIEALEKRLDDKMAEIIKRLETIEVKGATLATVMPLAARLDKLEAGVPPETSA